MNFPKTFPTLYKKTSTGAIQFWTISVYEDSDHSVAFKIETNYGQVGTESPQITFDTIYKGKNVGKKNETTVQQQAEAEALAKWEKQKKKGYVESIEAAQKDELDALIEGGVVPMLAHKFSEHAHKIKYYAYVQPKLDGIRCIAILKDGKCTLWSRTRKPITSMPHIVKFIETNFSGPIVFDGELYNHELKVETKPITREVVEGTITYTPSQINFEKIVSLVRQEEPGEGHELIQYHIYDLITDETFEDRTRVLESMLFFSENNQGPLREVYTARANSEEEILEWFNKFRAQGYEGCMVRNAHSKYVNKRSYDILKVKEFDDGEFDIIGIDEGRGKLAGHVGAFLCRTDKGQTFLAKMSGETDNLKAYFLEHKLWQGKRLTVQYQGLTGKEGVPRFPVGIAIRDYE